MMLSPILILVLILPSTGKIKTCTCKWIKFYWIKFLFFKIVCFEPKPIGCFNDIFWPRDLELRFKDSNLTLQKCLTECAENNLKYFGLQAGLLFMHYYFTIEKKKS